MARMASGTPVLIRLAVLAVLYSLAACGAQSAGVRPTVEPLIRVTPAPPQDISGTATVFARLIVPTATPTGVYIVKPGDTLSKITDMYETTIDELIQLNNLVDPNTLAVGQKLTIPSPLPPAEGPAGTTTAEAPPPESVQPMPGTTPAP